MDLVERAIAGEPLALDRLLLDAYPKLLARVDQKLPGEVRGAVAPEDIIQEVFATAFRNIGAFRPEGQDAFYRWLTAIADNRVIDVVRAQNAAKRGGGRGVAGQERSSIAALIDVVAVNDRTPSRSAGGHEAAAAVQVALAGLKPEYREALALRYLEGLGVAETAARMGKTEPAVHKLCSRGLQALREAMGEAAKYLSRAD
ncbi:MAG: sigma-70 family RNA polymerase sigma factor [Phycisphaeraceae bacterium]|nr:sigma-70 family RNA polymerase sigma factor [Phycisphaeraceae bacterium]